MIYDSDYKICMCYITDHFETAITDIILQKQTFPKSCLSIYDHVGC